VSERQLRLCRSSGNTRRFLRGVGMFAAALCSKQFNLNPAVSVLAQRSGDFLTALVLVAPSLRVDVLKSQSPLGVLCGLSTGLINTGAATYYTRAMVDRPYLRT
jgi:hypothetical protein